MHAEEGYLSGPKALFEEQDVNDHLSQIMSYPFQQLIISLAVPRGQYKANAVF